MRTTTVLISGLAAIGLFAGCNTFPPGAERGPSGTMAFEVPIEASEPGVKIEVNGQTVGTAPLRLKIWGDTDGTFHDFGSYYYVVRAIPSDTNHFTQSVAYNTGRAWGLEDRIPSQIFFDMSKPPAQQAPVNYGAAPPYPYPYYGPYYYGPRVIIGPGYYHRRWWW